jgi:hypothetical protein
MKTTQIIRAAIMSAAIFSLGSARAGLDASVVGKMEIVSVNKMIIETVDDGYVLRVGLTFQNGNPEAYKLRQGVFTTKAIAKHWEQGTEKPEVTSLEIGQGTLEQLELPGTADKTAKGKTTAEIVVRQGAKDPATTERIIALWNLVGNAENQISLSLVGSAQIGQEVSRGWVFEGNKAYDVELTFVPKLQRKVLFE